jgi:hypothetical protein
MASHTRRKGTAAGRKTQSNRPVSPAEKRTPIGAKNSAAFADGPGAVLEHVACGRALVSWRVRARLLGLPSAVIVCAAKQQSQKTPARFGQIVGLRRSATCGNALDLGMPLTRNKWLQCIGENKKLHAPPELQHPTATEIAITPFWPFGWSIILRV